MLKQGSTRQTSDYCCKEIVISNEIVLDLSVEEFDVGELCCLLPYMAALWLVLSDLEDADDTVTTILF